MALTFILVDKIDPCVHYRNIFELNSPWTFIWESIKKAHKVTYPLNHNIFRIIAKRLGITLPKDNQKISRYDLAVCISIDNFLTDMKAINDGLVHTFARCIVMPQDVFPKVCIDKAGNTKAIAHYFGVPEEVVKLRKRDMQIHT